MVSESLRYSKNDLLFLAGDFLLAGDNSWTGNHFVSDLNQSFVKYYNTFYTDLSAAYGVRGFCRLFQDHTGHSCSLPLVFRTLKKIKDLEAELQRAVTSFDIEKAAKMRSKKNRNKKSNDA